MSILAAPLASIQSSVTTGLLDPFNRILGYGVNWAMPLAIPGVADLVHAWRCNRLGTQALVKMLRFQGIEAADILFRNRDQPLGRQFIQPANIRAWLESFNLSGARPDVMTLMMMYMRNMITWEKFQEIAREDGWWNSEYQNLMHKFASNQLPQPGELISFAVRDVWDPVTVRDLQYDADYPVEFGHFMEQLGFNGDARMRIGGVPQGNPVTWAQMYWRAHWANISPTQAYEMYQRLRPGRVERYRAELPNIQPFTLNNLLDQLRINDYPPTVRDKLAAIAYHKPRLVDIDRFFAIGSIDRQEAYELHLDLGYSPADARTRVNWLELEKFTRPRDPSTKSAAKSILEMYTLGLTTYEYTRDKLVELYSASAAERLVPGLQINVNPAQQRRLLSLANRQIAAADQKEAIDRAKVLLGAVKRQFLSGQASERQARETLVAGLFQERSISFYLLKWRALLASGRMLLSTGNVRKLVLEGVMPFATAQRYLENLGWKEPELGFLLTELRRSLEFEAEKAAERMARDQEQAELAQIRQAQILNRERERTVRRLNRQASLAQLQRYFTRSIISEGDYERELRRRGIDDENVKRHIFDARISRAERLSRKRHVSDTLRQQDPNRLGAITPQTTPTPALPAPQGDAGNPFNPLG